jgi:hypothetical protein
LIVEDAEGELVVTGGPDFVILRRGLDHGVIDPVANSYLVGDWKTQAAVGTLRSACQVMAQAIALTDDKGFGKPAFLTDLVCGFRCWLVVDRVLFRFHPSSDEWLTLSEGVALIRYFIVHAGRLDREFQAELLRCHRDGSGHARDGSGGSRGGSGGAGGSGRGGSAGSSSGSGGSRGGSGGGGSGRGGGASGGTRGGSRPGGGSGGGSSQLPRSPLGKYSVGSICGSSKRCIPAPCVGCSDSDRRRGDQIEGDGGPGLAGESDGADSSPSSPSSQPLTPEEVAAYQQASYEEFAAEVRSVRDELGLSF